MSLPYIDKYLHLSDKDDKKKFDTFMGTTFDELVDHYDPNGTGLIEVEQMRSFLKTLVNDQ